METSDALEAVLEVTTILDTLAIPYLVGGSLASSLHGVPRSTEDADLVVELEPAKIEPLVKALQETFYIDEERVRDAVRRRASFNIIRLAGIFKIDLFVLPDTPGSRLEMERRQVVDLGDPERSIFVASAEDTVVQKLHWYRLGRGISERQWRDALGVLRVQKGRLDLDYLRETAVRLEVEGLLERALREAE